MNHEAEGSRGKIIDILTALSGAAAGALLIIALVTGSPGLGAIGQIMGVLYIFLLMFFLTRSRPVPVNGEYPEFETAILPRLTYRKTLLVIFAFLVFVFGLGSIIHPWLVLVIVLTIMSAAVILPRREKVHRGLIMQAVLIGLLCICLSALSGRLDGYQLVYLLCIPVMYVGGVVLVRETGLTNVRTADGKWKKAHTGFLCGCVLAIPPALLNISGGAQSGDVWVDVLWKPLTALVPGIAELRLHPSHEPCRGNRPPCG